MDKQELIEFTKKLRGFDARKVYDQKLKKINEFFKQEGLDSCVLGLSGGIDSSLVFKLLLDASEQPESPLKRVLGCFMPIYSNGITGQNNALMHINELLDVVCISYKAFSYCKKDLTEASKAYGYAMNVHNAKNSKWLQGQIDSIVRTPALYGMAAKMQTEEFKSIVVGTTNRDEGAYIGFFGKASDGMVDLQPIADLHKSEVYAISELCGIPKSIIERKPMGDVHDAKTDEEMIGAPYWFLEAYTNLLEFDMHDRIKDLYQNEEFKIYIDNIEKIHKHNAHKYKVGSPARYIDVIERFI